MCKNSQKGRFHEAHRNYTHKKDRRYIHENVHKFAQQAPFSVYYDSCRFALHHAVRKIWPNNPKKHYSLYSGRHQYCANLKISRKTLEEIALLMGHASMETATQHYGRRICGYSRFAPPKSDSPTIQPQEITTPIRPMMEELTSMDGSW